MKIDKLSTSDLVVDPDRDPVPMDTAEFAGTGGARMVKEPTLEPTTQTPLFADTECRDFRQRWDQIQIHFVDDPRQAAQDADSLVAETMKRLAQIFSDEKKNMESQWSRGDQVSTEDLRLAVQRYRSFFNRLLMM